MRLARSALIAACACAALLALPAASLHAQGRAPDGQKARPEIPAPPKKLPRFSGKDRARGLDFLIEALKVAPNEASAKFVEERIWGIWATTPSDTAALLMSRANQAFEAKNTDLALSLLDKIVKIRPDYIEGWNRRATIYYMRDDYRHAMADLHEVLSREPRHFGALAGLGMILHDIGDDKRALAAFRAALAINPHLDRIPDMVKTLTEKVEGRDI